MKQKVIIIAGPTASGKSGLAIKVAQKIKGEIVNADAFQVYEGLRVLTARPSLAEMQGIKHHLYGYVDNFTQEDVRGWSQKVAQLIPKIEHPIVVGGTGFYLSVLMNGLSPIPDISPQVREQVRLMDPKEVKAKLTTGAVPLDIQRQRRALEVLLETGHPIDFFQNLPKEKVLDADFKVFILLPPREKIYANIEKRLIQMLEADIVGEVARLVENKATGGVMQAIGVKELVDFVEKKCDLPTAAERILLATRHYAKRQMTWFRHEIPDATILQEVDFKNVITL